MAKFENANLTSVFRIHALDELNISVANFATTESFSHSNQHKMVSVDTLGSLTVEEEMHWACKTRIENKLFNKAQSEGLEKNFN